VPGRALQSVHGLLPWRDMRRHALLAYAPALAAVGCFCAVPSAGASAVDLFGLGARTQALGGAALSTARGFEATHVNPAGLAFAERPSVGVAYQSATFDLRIDGLAHEVPDAPALTLGFGVPLPFGGALSHRLALGLAFVLPQRSILVADLARPGDLTFPLLDVRAQTVSVLGAVAVRLSDALALGVGALALAELSGDIAVAPNAEGRLGTRVKDELLADYALVAGVTFRPVPTLAFAATWHGASSARFALPITADLGDDFSLPLPVLDVRGTAQYDPAQAAFEVSVRPTPWLLTALALAWERWSAFPRPLGYTVAATGTPPLPPLAFRDTWSPRLGLEAELPLSPTLTLRPRLGLRYEPSPVPVQRGSDRFYDSDRLIVALGAALALGELTVTLSGQLHTLADRAHPHATPASSPTVPATASPETTTTRGSVLLGALQLELSL